MPARSPPHLLPVVAIRIATSAVLSAQLDPRALPIVKEKKVRWKIVNAKMAKWKKEEKHPDQHLLGEQLSRT
jgi:hypothetical protein